MFFFCRGLHKTKSKNRVKAGQSLFEQAVLQGCFLTKIWI